MKIAIINQGMKLSKGLVRNEYFDLIDDAFKPQMIQTTHN